MCHYPDLDSASEIIVMSVKGKFASTNEKHYLELAGETSSAANVRSHSSHNILRSFWQPAVIFKNFMILENARVTWISRFIADYFTCTQTLS